MSSLNSLILVIFCIFQLIHCYQKHSYSCIICSNYKSNLHLRTSSIFNKNKVFNFQNKQSYKVDYRNLFVLQAEATPVPASDSDRKGPRNKKVKSDVIEVTGRVTESLPNATFRVEIEPSKQLVFATISGKIRKNQVRIIVGDSVVVELSAYDLTRGRITYRNK